MLETIEQHVYRDQGNGCHPLCACGCRRKAQDGDRILVTDHGVFIIGELK